MLTLPVLLLSHSHAKSLQAPSQPDLQGLPIVQTGEEVGPELSGLAGAPLANTPVDPPSLQPRSSTAGAPAEDSTAPNQPLSTQTPPMRQRLGEDLFRLVQVGTD